ncbi:unnamed protein product [Sphagnum tenellum]
MLMAGGGRVAGISTAKIFGRGVFVHPAGGVLSVTKCYPHQVVVVTKPENCTQDIPVLFGKRRMYVDPYTYILHNLPDQAACMPDDPQYYRIGRHLYEHFGEGVHQTAMKVQALVPKLHELLKYSIDISGFRGGLYSKEQAASVREIHGGTHG